MFLFFTVLIFCAFSSLEGALNVTPLKNIAPLGVRIVNGDEAEDGQFPWQVAIIGRSVIYPSYLCGGSLISDEWVLTAGHCVDGATAATIYSGSARFSSPNRTTSRASDFILHEDFNPSYLTNDIGLIRLQAPVKLNANTQPIALADKDPAPGSNVTVSGFGSISDSDPTPNSAVLNYITVSTIENLVCQGYYGNQVVTPGVLCTETGSPLKSPCSGDSGGPVVANVHHKDPVLVAVFSFVNGYGCEYPYPAGNSRIAYYRDWIKKQTGI